MSDTCSLLPPFGDPLPSCLLPYQEYLDLDQVEKGFYSMRQDYAHSQQEVTEITSYHQAELFRKDHKERGAASSYVLPTFQNPCGWNPFDWAMPVPLGKTRSEWLARDNPESNHTTIKPKTVSYMAEQSFWENPKGLQLTGRTDAEGEAPILWLPDAKSWLIGKDTEAQKDWW